ncbi:MAG: SWIB/MDM2 domain-containing protein [Candidatus ainarchaeum sp.]|nr:SWIB/MDM2 domain-containing protein [Candidatus ainarchaeum sp.]
MGLFGKKVATKTTGKKKPFGGYCVNFGGCTETMEDVFGKKDITPSEMTKKLWAYVKENKIAGKK